MKKIPIIKTFLVGSLLMGAVSLHATTYWVDSVNGNDNNNGMSGPAAAWKSIVTANNRWGTAQYPLTAGDHVEFANGSTWNYPILFTGVSGGVGNNILVQNYTPANGNTNPPLINAQNLWCGVQLWNCSCITIQGITVNGVNTGANGVFIYATNYISSGIVVDNINVQNTANLGSGVYVRPNTGGMVNNLTIKNSKFSGVYYGVDVDPLWGGAWWPWGCFFGATKILVDNITCTQNGGYDGLFLHNCQYVTFQNSTVTGAEASWMQACEFYLAHNIICTGAHAATDGTGIHIDFDNAYVTIEDCYFANNSGGFVEILPRCYNCCFRYNLSFNDGSRVNGQNGAGQNGKSLWIADNCENIYVYNNMISVSNFVSKISFGTNINAVIENNVLNYVGTTTDDPQFGNHLLQDGVNNCVVTHNNVTPYSGGYYGVAGLSGPAYITNPQLNQYGKALNPSLINGGVQVGLAPGDTGVAGGPAGVYTGFNKPATDFWGNLTHVNNPNVGAVQ